MTELHKWIRYWGENAKGTAEKQAAKDAMAALGNLADAWDEGWNEGYDYCESDGIDGVDNPYREQT